MFNSDFKKIICLCKVVQDVACECHDTHVDVKEHVEVTALLLPCGSQRWNSGLRLGSKCLQSPSHLTGLNDANVATSESESLLVLPAILRCRSSSSVSEFYAACSSCLFITLESFCLTKASNLLVLRCLSYHCCFPAPLKLSSCPFICSK